MSEKIKVPVDYDQVRLFSP